MSYKNVKMVSLKSKRDYQIYIKALNDVRNMVNVGLDVILERKEQEKEKRMRFEE